MEEKKEAKETEVQKKQPKASEAKKITRKTESAAEIDVVQTKKLIPVKKKIPLAEAPKAASRSRKVKRAEAKDVGVDIEPPVRSCEDRFCPFHGKLSVRGISLDVQVVSKKMENTIVVKRERRHYLTKYQRYEKRTSRMFAHLPPCVDVEVGDMVRIMECRPLSKGTSMVVLGRI